MHGQYNEWDEKMTNGHNRVYVFEQEYPDYPRPRRVRDMVFVSRDDISTLVGYGTAYFTRSNLAAILWSNRNSHNTVSIIGYYDHLYCNCPKRVTECTDDKKQKTNFYNRPRTAPKGIDTPVKV